MEGLLSMGLSRLVFNALMGILNPPPHSRISGKSNSQETLQNIWPSIYFNFFYKMKYLLQCSGTLADEALSLYYSTIYPNSQDLGTEK